jgi:hypothetical protein
MPEWLEPAIRRVMDLDELAELEVGDLAPELPDPAGRTVLVRRLIREGVLTIRGGR